MFLVLHCIIRLCFVITWIYSWEAENGKKKPLFLESFRPIIIHVGYRKQEDFRATVPHFVSYGRSLWSAWSLQPLSQNVQGDRQFSAFCTWWWQAKCNSVPRYSLNNVKLKAKLSLCLIKHYAIKSYGGVRYISKRYLKCVYAYVETTSILMWRCVYRASYCNVLMWRCVNRASYCNVLMTNEMHNSYNQFFYSTVFCLLYMFRKNLVVHHQEHHIIYCITQFGTIVQASLAAMKL